jgi:hypothetical protein
MEGRDAERERIRKRLMHLGYEVEADEMVEDPDGR